MESKPRGSLDDYLALDYSLRVTADPEGGYVLDFPDLPGCMSQVETLEEVGPTAIEIKHLWLSTTYEQGLDIPLPTYPEEYSGKFNLRLPRSLHRQLAEAAERDGVSLNQYVVMLLTRGVTADGLEQAIARIEGALGDRNGQEAPQPESVMAATAGARVA